MDVVGFQTSGIRSAVWCLPLVNVFPFFQSLDGLQSIEASSSVMSAAVYTEVWVVTARRSTTWLTRRGLYHSYRYSMWFCSVGFFCTTIYYYYFFMFWHAASLCMLRSLSGNEALCSGSSSKNRIKPHGFFHAVGLPHLFNFSLCGY